MEENVIQINSGITINADVSVKNGKFLVSIMDNLAITCDKVTESYDKEKKTIPTNFNEMKPICKMPNFYILLGYLLVTMALSIVVSVYCCLIKYWAIQKHLLPFHVPNDKLK